MEFAERLKPVHPSMTLSINTRAQELKAQGIDVLSLAVGEPDFPTPEHIREAAKKAIDENFTRYTPVPGIPALRRAVALTFERHYNVSVDPQCIIIGNGGKQSLYTFFQAILNPGDEVLIPTPWWVSYPDMVLLAGGKPVAVPTSVKSGFKADPTLLETKRTSATRVLVLNSPSNPTGAVYGEDEFAAIMDWAIRNNIFVISDEIYDQLVYPPAKMASAIAWFARFPDHVAVVNGLSKSYAMTGWRVGYLAGAEELIKKMTVLQGHMTSNVCSIAQKAALAALEGPDDCVARMRETFRRRRDLALEMIGQWPHVVCPKPDGAFYVFVDVSKCYNSQISDSISLCKHLLEKAHVAAVPGAAFDDDRCIRLSCAVSNENLEKALAAIGKVLKSLG